MGQLVGLGIERPIAQPRIGEHQRPRLRPALDLLFKQLMHATLRRIGHRRRVPAMQHLLTLARRQHVQAAHRGVRTLLKPRHQLRQRPRHEGEHPLRPDARGDLRLQLEALPQVVHRQPERIVRPLLGVQHLDVPPGRVHHGLRILPLAIAIVQERREQRRRRRNPAAALRQRQRGMLVLQQFGQSRMRRPHRLRQPRPIQSQAQRQRVDVDAQPLLRPRPSLHPPEQHRAEHHIVRSPLLRPQQLRRQDGTGSPRSPKPPSRTRNAPTGPAPPPPPLTRAVALHVHETERRRRPSIPSIRRK